MRFTLVCFVSVCMACGEAPAPETTSTHSAAAPAIQESATSKSAESTAVPASVQPVEAPKAVAQAPVAKPAMDYTAVESKVRDTYVQNPKIGAQRANSMTSTSMSLIKASHDGDEANVTTYSGLLLNQALLGQGFGLVDGGALAKAIQDLVKAAKDADVDGILKAVKDITAAS